ncbi:MAG: glycosyltransferase [Xanthobacteraceae bacterium]
MPRPSRIMFVTTGLRVGGAEAMLARLVTAQPRVAEEITVVSLLRAEAYVDRLRAAGVAVAELGFEKSAHILPSLLELARMIGRTRPDIVQGWMYHGDLAALLALSMSGRRKRTRLVWSIRCSQLELEQYGPRLRMSVKACTLLSGLPDVITANSAAGLQSHLSLGYRPRRAEVIANGIDIHAFRPDQEARMAVRRDLALSEDAIVLAHVARVDPMKDHPAFLAALASLPQLKALLIGAGTERLRVPPNALALGRRNDVPRLFAAADFVVSTSSFGEGFPNVVAEGMACGLPAVATDVGDAKAIVGDTGLIVAAGDHLALCSAIRKLVEEPRLVRVNRGAQARARIADNFALSRAVERYHQFYGNMLAAARPSDS